MMKSKKKIFLGIGAFSFLTVVFLIGTQSYFNNKIINLASDGCYEIGGSPKLERDFFAINYSFSCQINK